MKIQLLSDLHLEANPGFLPEPAPGANLLVLAGDIGSYQTRRDGSVMTEPDWGLQRFSPLPQHAGWPVPVVFVPGNHEYDAMDVDEAHRRLFEACERLGIQWLERETLRFGDVRLIGTTLWADYDALGGMAPTLPAARGSLPPEGAGPALGRPGGEAVTPTLPAARGSLPPEGAGPALGRPGGEAVAPTLPAARGSLPPEGAGPALGRPGGEAVTPTLPAARGSLPPEGAGPALGRPGGEAVASGRSGPAGKGKARSAGHAALATDPLTHRLRQREKAFRAANFYLVKMASERHGRPFDAEAMRALALDCQHWLREALAQPFEGSTVVVTHFAPTLHSADPRYGLSPGTAGFCNALDDLLPQADLWLHGHLHCPQDRQVGRCRIVANPLGYADKGEQTAFEPQTPITVPKRLASIDTALAPTQDAAG